LGCSPQLTTGFDSCGASKQLAELQKDKLVNDDVGGKIGYSKDVLQQVFGTSYMAVLNDLSQEYNC